MPERDALRAHCVEVTNCRLAASVLVGPMSCLAADALHCAPLISAQFLARRASSKSPPADVLPWLVPEPWNGHLRTAPLLFIGQNPAVGEREVYPDSSWMSDGEKVFNYFENRYREGYPENVPFLTQVRAIAEHIIAREAQPGVDFAITEAVRCKATKAAGIERAVKSCAELHLKTTLSLSGARVVLCLGATSREGFRIATDVALPPAKPVEWNGKLVVGLPHPSAWGGEGQKGPPDEVLKQLKQHLLPAGRSS